MQLELNCSPKVAKNVLESTIFRGAEFDPASSSFAITVDGWLCRVPVEVSMRHNPTGVRHGEFAQTRRVAVVSIEEPRFPRVSAFRGRSNAGRRWADLEPRLVDAIERTQQQMVKPDGVFQWVWQREGIEGPANLVAHAIRADQQRGAGPFRIAGVPGQETMKLSNREGKTVGWLDLTARPNGLSRASCTHSLKARLKAGGADQLEPFGAQLELWAQGQSAVLPLGPKSVSHL